MTKSAKLLAAVLGILLFTAACSSGDDDASSVADDASTVTAEPVDGESDGVDAVAEVASLTITAVSFANSTVTIRNDGAEAIDLSGHFMCNRPNYSEMPAETLEAGSTLEIDASALGIDGSGGEFAVYQSNSFSSAEDILAYVQWGAAGNGRASVAVEAGLIDEGDFVDNGGEDFTAG